MMAQLSHASCATPTAKRLLDANDRLSIAAADIDRNPGRATMTSRMLADSPAVLLIVYSPGPGAEAGGYHPWLQAVDNPFFNAIPGVHHYANWKLEQLLHGEAPGYDYFDFQGLANASDLERVWFNPDLDHFRTEWIRKWGYAASPHPAQAYAFLMEPVGAAIGAAEQFARITAGTGTPPSGADRCWRITETIRKHYAAGATSPDWRAPIAGHNPLGFDWVAIAYGRDPAVLASSYSPGPEALAMVARLIAAPA
jgi:hypothetical protein